MNTDNMVQAISVPGDARAIFAKLSPVHPGSLVRVKQPIPVLVRDGNALRPSVIEVDSVLEVHSLELQRFRFVVWNNSGSYCHGSVRLTFPVCALCLDLDNLQPPPDVFEAVMRLDAA